MKINEKFKSLIAPLTPEEFAQLEQNIINEGCRDSIVTWEGVIIDGHNRFKICTENNIPFSTTEREFENESKAIEWIILNQFGRRNLSNYQRSILALMLTKLFMDKSRENLRMAGENFGKGCQNSDKAIVPIDTKKELAKVASVSHDTIAKVRVIEEKAPEEVKQQLIKGDVSINKAYNDIKRQEKKQKFEQSKAAFNAEVIQQSKTVYSVYEGDCNEYMRQTPERFDLVLTDPPYAMDFKSGWNDWDKIQGDKRSDTKTLLAESFKNIKSVMNEDAQIYVFGNPYELGWLKPLFCEYFNLKNILVWDRGVIGMGDLSTYGRSFDVILFGYNEKWRGLNGIRERDVLQFDRVSPGQLEHPTQKPTSILEFLIKKSSNEGQNIFDPFAGSCSTLKAAQSLNRNAYGCEIETKYIQ